MESSSSSAASAPHSPATTMTSNSPDQDHDHDHQPTAQNSLDDIFGSSPPPNTIHDELTGQPAVTGAEPSELPSLRRQHVTAGYRDGISVSKGERVQDGFDAGFPVGAQLGMRAGTVLGILEGLVRGFEGRAGGGVVKKLPVRNKSAGSEGKGNGATEKEEDNVDARRKAKREEILKLYQRAVKDMAVQNVFAGLDSSLANPDVSDEKPETHLARQGDAAVSTWEERVRVAQWEANMEALEEKEKHETATTEPEHS